MNPWEVRSCRSPNRGPRNRIPCIADVVRRWRLKFLRIFDSASVASIAIRHPQQTLIESNFRKYLLFAYGERLETQDKRYNVLSFITQYVHCRSVVTSMEYIRIAMFNTMGVLFLTRVIYKHAIELNLSQWMPTFRNYTQA
jgi:hypothetical protein